MAVSIRVARVQLVKIKPDGTVLEPNSGTLKESLVYSSEHRVADNTTGSAPAPNSANWPTIEAYLQEEAADDYALAYMDQNRIVTQMVT